MIDQILKVECHQEGSELIVSVTNRGVGHNFPGERHNRTLAWECQQFNADNNAIEMEKVFIKGVTPFRGESSTEKIKAGETVNQHFLLEKNCVRAIVKLIYKRFPMASAKEIILFTKEVSISDPT